MADRSWQYIWMEQCDASAGIRVRYGLKAAFDYVVGEKLLHFAEAAARDPEFAREIPRFVSRVRSMFTADEIRTHLARIERERREAVVTDVESDDLDFANPAMLEERAQQFEFVKKAVDRSHTRYILNPTHRRRPGDPLGFSVSACQIRHALPDLEHLDVRGRPLQVETSMKPLVSRV